MSKAARLTKQAAGEGAEIICLPELATNIYFPFEINPKWLKLAETIPGPSTETMQAAARDANVYLLFPMYEKVQDGELYNTAALHRPERQDHRQVPQAPHPARAGRRHHGPREVLLPAREPRLPGVADRDRRQRRHGHLLRPALPRRRAGARAQRLRPHVRADGDGRGAVDLGAGAEGRTRSPTACGWPGSTGSASRPRTAAGRPTSTVARATSRRPARSSPSSAMSRTRSCTARSTPRSVRHSANEWGFFRDRRPDAYASLVAP